MNNLGQLQMDNMQAWRGEMTSTISHLKEAIDKQEVLISNIVALQSQSALECEKHRAEVRDAVKEAISKAAIKSVEEQNSQAIRIVALENTDSKMPYEYATKEEVNNLGKEISKLHRLVASSPIKVGSVLLLILAVYEAVKAIVL